VSDRLERPRESVARPLSEEARKAARTVTVEEAAAGSIAAIAESLPDPTTLPPRTLVIVSADVRGARSLARSLLAVFGRTKKVARASRCTALVIRGYVDVGAAEDEGGDLAWGYAPGAPPSP
jgi:hypothetical protein